MTDRFLKAMVDIFKHEGGYVNNPNDSGRATNMGVSLTFLEGLGLKRGDFNKDGKIDAKDIKLITKDIAQKIYWDNFWNPVYDKIQERVGLKVFDMAVNAGSSRAHKILQVALNNLGEKLTVDGVFGKGTMTSSLKYQEQELLDAYCVAQANFYKALVVSKPKNKVFLKNWLQRAAWQPK